MRLLPNSVFRVRLSNGRKIVACVSGEIELESAKMSVGRRVGAARVRRWLNSVCVVT